MADERPKVPSEESNDEAEFLNLAMATIDMGLLRRRRSRRHIEELKLEECERGPFTGGGTSKEIITISFKK